MSTVRHTTITTSLGDTTLVADGDVLIGCWFDADDTSAFGESTAPGGDPVLGPAATQFVEYLAGDRTAFDIPLRADGDEFALAVWAALRDVPYGETTTYGELAIASAISSWHSASAGHSDRIRSACSYPVIG